MAGLATVGALHRRVKRAGRRVAVLSPPARCTVVLDHAATRASHGGRAVPDRTLGPRPSLPRPEAAA